MSFLHVYVSVFKHTLKCEKMLEDENLGPDFSLF